MPPKQPKPRKKAKELGFEVVYVPHRKIEDYNACYRVSYMGKTIYPPPADKLDIPLNEIWISEAYRKYEKIILYHELKEIQFRAMGYEGDTAHQKAVKATEQAWKGHPLHERFRREVNIAPLKFLQQLPGIDEALAVRIMKNRPYYSLNELKDIPGVSAEVYKDIKDKIFCITEEDDKD